MSTYPAVWNRAEPGCGRAVRQCSCYDAVGGQKVLDGTVEDDHSAARQAFALLVPVLFPMS
jgi:hypothetical protein